MFAAPIQRIGIALVVTAWVSSGTLAQDQQAKRIPQLVWQDEFEGDALDYSKWGVEENAFGGGNEELQIYTDRAKNVRVADGHLILEVHRDEAGVSGTVREYSSGRVRTKNRGDWKYGRIEVRAKLPSGAGIWPAIWMLPTSDHYGPWAASGEIDIVELKGSEPDTIHGTLHYGNPWPKNASSGKPFKLDSGTFSDDFHVFAIDWSPGKIEWLVDGEHYQTQTKWRSSGGPFPAPFDQEFHLVLNIAIGGHFVGSPDEQSTFPARMLVDYVRVYQ